MATSGTVGTTIIDTTTVIDHAVRRCGLVPSTLVPENLETALNNLFFILSELTNRGINLWCIDDELVGLAENRSIYSLQPGTIDVLSVNYCTGDALSHDATEIIDRYTATFSTSVAVKRIGIYYSVSREHDWIVEVSLDGTTWATAADLGTVQGYAGNWTWHNIDPAYATPYFRIRDTREDPQGNFTGLDVSQFRLLNSVREVPVSVMSRDTYNDLPDKRVAGVPNQYYFNKQIVPELFLWPEPNTVFAHLLVRRHREIMDVGTMQQQLEIPNRWFQAIIWKLASVLCFELSGVEKERRLEIAAFAATSLKEAEDGETDGSPFYLQPKISGYTK